MENPRIRVAVVQLEVGGEVAANVAAAEQRVREAAADGARLVVLPEKWNAIGEPDTLRAAAEPSDGPTLARAAGWARELDIWLLAGSIVVRDPGEELLRNLSVLIGPDGRQHAWYAKAHMFDVDIDGVRYRESDSERPGDDLVVTEVDGIAVGMSVCYDLRFPELYRLLALDGAHILTVPAAFTTTTGRAHWATLLRARAIENGCFVLAANVVGDHGGGKTSYGHSMIIDPWGEVLATIKGGAGVAVVDLDLGMVERVRRAVPSLANRRPDLYAFAAESDRTPSKT